MPCPLQPAIESTQPALGPGRRGYRRRGQVDGKSKVWIAIAASAIALAVAVYAFSAKAGSGGSYDDFHVQCTACNHQFTMTALAATEERAKVGKPRKNLTCPKCRKEAGMTMMQCGKCNDWYLPNFAAGSDALKCPHCGHDPRK